MKKKINKEITLPKSKYEGGYTKQEILDIIRPLGIHHKTFNKKMGVNTGTISKTGELLFYGYDICLAIDCCLEKREKTFTEWD